MKKLKTIVSGLMAAAMILTLTACEEELPQSTASGDGGAAPGTTTGITTTAATTTRETDKAVQEAAGNAVSDLANPDLKVTKRLKWMAWWDIDETTAEAELFKSAYGVPAEGDDPARAGRIFEYTNVPYGERYDKLATAIQSGSSPDLFPFEIRDFPYGVLRGRYQPIDEILDLSLPKWDGARNLIEQFKLNGRYYCAIYSIDLDAVLWYRKSTIADAGLDDPRELFEAGNWNWETFLDMCRRFQDSGDDKYALDGYSPDKDLLISTGVPIIGNNGTEIISNMYDPSVERATDLLKTLQVENLRYPRHELNNWNVNPKEWANGNILFDGGGGAWYYEGDSGLGRYKERFGWASDEIQCVPFPKDPQADKYYHFGKQDALMWCKGSTNKDGVAAWIDCCATAALNPEVTAAGKEKRIRESGWDPEVLDFYYSLTTLDGSSPLTYIFDFKNGIGTDIADTGSIDSPVEQLTQYIYLTGTMSYTQAREANAATINSRIDEINATIASAG